MYDSCWMKIPYASIFALLVLLAGIGCFCGPFFLGVTHLEDLLGKRDLFNLHNEVQWMGDLKIGLTIAGVVMGCYGITLLVFGALATGSTRKNVYSGAKCILGGRCSAIFFMLITYFFNLLWMAITSAMSIPIILFIMLKSICDTEFSYQNYQPGGAGRGLHCFNMTRLGVYFWGYNKQFPDQFWWGPAICNQDDLSAMCQVVNEEIPLFSAAFAGSFLIVVGLVTFLIVLGVNYQKIKTSKELTDYREALEQDNTEMDNIISSRRPYNSSYATESVVST